MLDSLRLLLPALIPSWNFFDVIVRSPRIEYALGKHAKTGDWREFRPRPQRVSGSAMLSRLVWNPRWNEALFVVSCAERLIAEPTAHSEDEIFRRIAADLADSGERGGGRLHFRILLVDAAAREVAYVAQPRRLADIAVR